MYTKKKNVSLRFCYYLSVILYYNIVYIGPIGNVSTRHEAAATVKECGPPLQSVDRKHVSFFPYADAISADKHTMGRPQLVNVYLIILVGKKMRSLALFSPLVDIITTATTRRSNNNIFSTHIAYTKLDGNNNYVIIRVSLCSTFESYGFRCNIFVFFYYF